MNLHDQTTFDHRIADWLEEDPTIAPAQPLEIVLAALPSIKQRRAWRMPRRFTMTTWPKLAIGVMVVAALPVVMVVAVGGAAQGPRSGPGSKPTPGVSPTPSGSASQQAGPVSVRFTSPLYRYSLQMPAMWTVTPATAPWPGGFQLSEDPAYADTFLARLSPGDSLSVKAQALASGTTASAWLADRERAFEVGGHCFGSAVPWTDSGVAGIAARRLEWHCDSVQDEKSNYDIYLFVAGDTGYVISGYPPMADGIRSFKTP